jgi:hypothetical protein
MFVDICFLEIHLSLPILDMLGNKNQEADLALFQSIFLNLVPSSAIMHLLTAVLFLPEMMTENTLV